MRVWGSDIYKQVRRKRLNSPRLYWVGKTGCPMCGRWIEVNRWATSEVKGSLRRQLCGTCFIESDSEGEE